ncbi:MAG: outer membrane beta-barrel protein [Ginsengibacter sp.]
MDKNLHSIEDLFKKGLEDNEDTPSQKAWDGIEKSLDKENVVSIKRKYELLKKVALLLLLLVTGLSIYVWKNRDKNVVKPNNSISSINNENKTKYKPLTPQTGTTILQKQVDSLAFDKPNNRNQIIKPSHKAIDKNIFKDENIDPKKFLNSLTSKNLSNTSIKKNKSKFINPNESRLQDDSKSLVLKRGKWIKKNQNEVVETKTRKQIEDKQPDSVNPSGIQFGNNLPAIETLNSKNVGNAEKNKVGKFATKESLQNIALAQINPLAQIGKTLIRNPSIKSTNQSRFAITAFYSPDITFYHYEDNDQRNSNTTDFKKSETENYSSTFGVLIDYMISKHWGLQSGVTLATSNFDLEPKTLYAQPDNTGGIKYKLSTPLGDAYVLPSFSNNPDIGDSIFSKSTTHTLQYIGIPLSVKYNLYKGKFTLNIRGGIRANFLTSGRITTELKSGNDNETETTNKIHGLKQSYFSGLAGIGVDYNFYKKWFLSFSPTIRFALNSINSNVPVNSFPNSVGFGLGLKMEF